MIPQWEYHVRLYSNVLHATARRGELVLYTKHTTKASKDIEVEAAWNRNDIACIEVTSLKTGTVETLYD